MMSALGVWIFAKQEKIEGCLLQSGLWMPNAKRFISRVVQGTRVVWRWGGKTEKAPTLMLFLTPLLSVSFCFPRPVEAALIRVPGAAGGGEDRNAEAEPRAGPGKGDPWGCSARLHAGQLLGLGAVHKG